MKEKKVLLSIEDILLLQSIIEYFRKDLESSENSFAKEFAENSVKALADKLNKSLTQNATLEDVKEITNYLEKIQTLEQLDKFQEICDKAGKS